MAQTQFDESDPIDLLFATKLDHNNKLDDESYELLEKLIKRYPYQNYAEVLFQRGIEKNIPIHKIAAILEPLVWMTPDHGNAIRRTLESWLQQTEREKIELALLVDDYFPFDTLAKMMAVFRGIQKKHGQFKARCRVLINKRVREQGIGKWSYLKHRFNSLLIKL